MQSLSSSLGLLKEIGKAHGNLKDKLRVLLWALSCFREHHSGLLNNLGRALWKLNYSLQHDEVSSQLGVPLVDSLLDNSVAWQAIRSDGDEYISMRGRVIPSSLCPFQLHQPLAL